MNKIDYKTISELSDTVVMYTVSLILGNWRKRVFQFKFCKKVEIKTTLIFTKVLLRDDLYVKVTLFNPSLVLQMRARRKKDHCWKTELYKDSCDEKSYSKVYKDQSFEK